MRCPKCGFENKQNKTFCTECATSLTLRCPNCNAEIEETEKFCGACAHDLREPKEASPIDYSTPQSYTPKFLADKILTTRSSIEGERKLVTVLFADVANYTSIAERLDPEEIHQIMDGCFKILMDEIHSHEGTINQFTGDGVMALFGAPVAHEDHAQRACHAALSIQGAMERYSKQLQSGHGVDFKIRIGLNSGHVVVGSIGDDLRMDYTAVGDTTNLASRIEGMAGPGTILVSKSTHRMARDFFEFEPLGKVEVKGKEEPLETYQLVKASEIETRIEAAVARGLTKFVGRKKSMAALKEALELAASGAGQVVGIVGEAGVGKSRLLFEMRRQFCQDELTYLEGRCLHYGGSMAYLPILDILRSYFEINEDDKEHSIKEKLKEKVLRLDSRLENALPPFHELFSLKIEDQYYVQNEPQQRKQRVFEAIRDVLVLQSQNHPVVVAVEDLHWIDRTSQEFLDYLVEWLPNASILLILLYRPEYTHQWGSKSYYSKIGLDQLSTQTSAELVQFILEGGTVVPELRELILSRTGGNPLFMEEFTHSLLENGSIERKDNQYVLSKRAYDIQIPDTIQGIIAARIDRIEENLKRVMQVASVIGRDFAYRILQSITGMREELKSSLLNLQGLEFIYEKSLFPELEYIFKHALTQEVAYNSLLLKRRKEIHERIGEAIEALYSDKLEEYYEMLAYHYTRSENTEKAVEYLDLANQKAARVCAMEEAKSYFDEAMALLDTLPSTEDSQTRRISLLVNQWLVFFLLAKYSEYYEHLTRYESLANELGNDGLLGMFNVCRADSEWWFGRFDQAIERGIKAADLCEATGNFEYAGHAYVTLVYCRRYKGNYEQAFSMKDAALNMMKQRFNLRCYAWAVGGAAWAYTDIGRWDEAIREGLEALRVAEEYSDNSMVSFAAWTLSFIHTYKGDLKKGLEYGELGVQKAPTLMDRVWAQATLAMAWCRAGEPQRGVDVLAQIFSMCRAVGFKPSEIPYGYWLGEGYWLMGDYDKAREVLEETMKIAESCGEKPNLAATYRILGEIFLATDPKQAAEQFNKSIAISNEIKSEDLLARAYAGLGRLHKHEGNIAEAKEYLTNALAIFERLGTLIEPDKVRGELAELPQD